MKEPVDHIIRPRLPWRSPDEPAVTECGYDASKVKALTRAEFFQRMKELGDRRTAMLTCMTCSDTARNHKTWEEDPRRAIEREVMRVAIEREVIWECRGSRWGNNERGTRLKDELIAMAALVEAHRDEFDSTISAATQKREWLEKKAAHRARAPKPRDIPGL